MVPLVAAILGVGGGTILGFVIRQPEINQLKRQIKELQKDNSRLKTLMAQQQENVEKLMVEYASFKFYQRQQKEDVKQNIKEEIRLGYEYKEYVDLLQRALREGGNESFTQGEKIFFELCTRQIEDKKKLTEDEEEAKKQYILKKYGKEISRMKDVKIVEYIENMCA